MSLIRLHPRIFRDLPAHSSLPGTDTRPELPTFVQDALREALVLLHSVPSTFTQDPKLRSSAPCTAKVKLFRNRRSVTDPYSPKSVMSSEFWVCRQSEHVDAKTKGTASWDEFEAGLRSHHAEHEMDYTPSVSSVERLVEWTRAEVGEIKLDDRTFKDVDVESKDSSLNSSRAYTNKQPVNMITHTFNPGALIAPRTFIVFTISAAYESTQQDESGEPQKGFVTVQIPLQSTPSHTPAELHEKITSLAPKRAIFAHYASVEHVSLLPPAESNAPRRIEWTMATTSDAGGSIPQWVQRNWTLGGVPRAVVADVGLFIGWTDRRRST